MYSRAGGSRAKKKGASKRVAGLGVVGLLVQSVHLNAKMDSGTVLLRQVELAMLLKTRASVLLTQGLELGPLLVELLRETALRRNGAGPSGLLVLRAGRRRGGNLTPLECLVEAVDLRSFLQPHLASGLLCKLAIFAAGERGEHGNLQT